MRWKAPAYVSADWDVEVKDWQWIKVDCEERDGVDAYE